MRPIDPAANVFRRTIGPQTCCSPVSRTCQGESYHGDEGSTVSSAVLARLFDQYSCGPVRFSGDENASYERHLVFDHVLDPENATLRERFEAFARAVRDLLSQRWLKTQDTYVRRNAKYVY